MVIFAICPLTGTYIAESCRNIEVNPYNPVTSHSKHILGVDIMVVDKGDFDVATTFSNIGPRERAYSEYETELVKNFGKLLVGEGTVSGPRSGGYKGC
jgi:hypothetical protein